MTATRAGIVVAGVVAGVVIARRRRRRRRVYVEEVPSGSRPIEGVGTSTAAFVGLAPPPPR